MSDLHADSSLPPGRFLVLISARGCGDPRAIVLLKGLGQLKNPMISSGIEPMTSLLVAQCLNQLCYCVPLHKIGPSSYFKKSSQYGICTCYYNFMPKIQ
jgi:hypothetical protein